MMAKKPKEIHGNKAKASPDARTAPLNIANMATTSNRHDNETPIRCDENVAYARKFVEENKK